MLAVTHHIVVQIAAIGCGYGSMFVKYVVLGDDVVIFDKMVADRYLQIMQVLGVSINLLKSVQSEFG